MKLQSCILCQSTHPDNKLAKRYPNEVMIVPRRGLSSESKIRIYSDRVGLGNRCSLPHDRQVYRNVDGPARRNSTRWNEDG